MRKVGMGFVGLLMLAACGGAEVLPGATMADGHAEAVCNQQSDWARSGKVDGGNIIITCPGYGRPTQSYAQNSSNRRADMYRAGFAGALAVATAK